DPVQARERFPIVRRATYALTDPRRSTVSRLEDESLELRNAADDASLARADKPALLVVVRRKLDVSVNQRREASGIDAADRALDERVDSPGRMNADRIAIAAGDEEVAGGASCCAEVRDNVRGRSEPGVRPGSSSVSRREYAAQGSPSDA